MKNPEVFINLSGGIDSTYLAWSMLSKNKNVLLHHCKMTNHEGRSIPEQNAVQKILDWFKKNNLKNFKYIETEFNYGNTGHIIRDIEVIYFITAAILRGAAYRSIKEIAISANAHDESNDPNDASVIRRRELLKLIGPNKKMDGYELSYNITFPMISKTKKEIIEEMPKELFELTWFCRTPLSFDKNGSGLAKNDPQTFIWKACKSCKTCKSVINSISK